MCALTYAGFCIRRLLSLLCLPAKLKTPPSTSTSTAENTNKSPPTDAATCLVKPHLCGQCKEWDEWSGIFAAEFGMWYRVTYQDLSQNTYCLVCKLVLDVVKARVRCCDDLQGPLESQVAAVHIKAPFYLDQLWAGGTDAALRRVDLTNATYLIIPLWLDIDIEIQGEIPPPVPPRNTLTGSNSILRRPKSILDRHLKSTPLVRAYYRRDASSMLCDLKSWDVPYFEVAALREWINNCQANHGDQCGRAHHSRTFNIPYKSPFQ